MSYQLIIEERAIHEAQDAFDHYETEQAGLGVRFKNELEKAIDYLLVRPKHFQKIKKEIRQAFVPGFPYLIIYEIMGENIVVYAVFHTSRNPRKKISK